MPAKVASNSLPKACKWMIVVGGLNWLLYVAGAIYLGGDAVNGKVDDGHFYLFGVRTESGRKVYTEVSESVFKYSRFHTYTLFVTGPLVIASAIALNRYKRRFRDN